MEVSFVLDFYAVCTGIVDRWVFITNPFLWGKIMFSCNIRHNFGKRSGLLLDIESAKAQSGEGRGGR